MAKKKGAGNPKSEDRLIKLLISIDARISNIEERLSDMATKDNLDQMRNRLDESLDGIRLEIRALGRAVDKDSLTIMDFDKRITRIEKREAV